MVQNLFLHRLKIYLLIMIMLPVFLLNVAYAAERYAISGDIANIRSGPGTNYEILYKAEKYYPIVIEEKLGDWYQFKDYEGDLGWIHKSLVSKTETIITTKSKNNIRSGPGTNFQVLFISEQGVPFRVLKTQGSWINVRHSEGYEGWIHKSLVW